VIVCFVDIGYHQCLSFLLIIACGIQIISFGAEVIKVFDIPGDWSLTGY
jgi:hypothetical protein